MEIKSLNELNKEDHYKVNEEVLISLGYYTEGDQLDSKTASDILRRTYKKIKVNLNTPEPSIIVFLNGFILSKIWMEKGRISRVDGGPAEISYDETGIIEKSWFIHGRCINDEIAFICLKNSKEKDDINQADISFIKDMFHIK